MDWSPECLSPRPGFYANGLQGLVSTHQVLYRPRASLRPSQVWDKLSGPCYFPALGPSLCSQAPSGHPGFHLENLPQGLSTCCQARCAPPSERHTLMVGPCASCLLCWLLGVDPQSGLQHRKPRPREQKPLRWGQGQLSFLSICLSKVHVCTYVHMHKNPRVTTCACAHTGDPKCAHTRAGGTLALSRACGQLARPPLLGKHM